MCLSLLGTWQGGRGESWSPEYSTVLQVLISIQVGCAALAAQRGGAAVRKGGTATVAAPTGGVDTPRIGPGWCSGEVDLAAACVGPAQPPPQAAGWIAGTSTAASAAPLRSRHHPRYTHTCTTCLLFCPSPRPQSLILVDEPWYNEPGYEQRADEGASNRYSAGLMWVWAHVEGPAQGALPGPWTPCCPLADPVLRRLPPVSRMLRVLLAAGFGLHRPLALGRTARLLRAPPAV